MTKKYRVVTRVHYESAYIAFFVKWYLAIGFNQVVILKADNIPLPDLEIFSDPARVLIVQVENTGNNILNDNYKYFRDLEWDWVLNVDCDEFLMFDFNKYPAGINDLITDIECWIPEPDKLQQIAFRWVCINKLDIKPGGDTLKDIIQQYPTHMYKYHKCLGKPKYMVEEPKINCHFYYTTPLLVNEAGPETKPHYIKYELFDDKITAIRDNYVGYVNSTGQAFKWGFILHLNSRSLANTLTKSLTTKLRENKRISDMTQFTSFVNSYSGDGSYMPGIHDKLFQFLNRKGTFPADIAKWDAQYRHRIPEPAIRGPLDSIPAALAEELIVDREIENNILRDLCVQVGINYDRCMLVLKACC